MYFSRALVLFWQPSRRAFFIERVCQSIGHRLRQWILFQFRDLSLHVFSPSHRNGIINKPRTSRNVYSADWLQHGRCDLNIPDASESIENRRNGRRKMRMRRECGTSGHSAVSLRNHFPVLFQRHPVRSGSCHRLAWRFSNDDHDHDHDDEKSSLRLYEKPLTYWNIDKNGYAHELGTFKFE